MPRDYRTDLAGAALLVAVVAGGYALLIHDLLGDAMRHDRVEARRVEMAQSLAELQSQQHDLERAIIDETDRLDQGHAQLPRGDAIDSLLSRLNEISNHSGVTVDRWQPTGTVIQADYQTRQFRMEATATFSDLCRWLALMEEGVAYLDITHFAIREPSGLGGPCQFECSMRFYCGVDEPETVYMAGRE